MNYIYELYSYICIMKILFYYFICILVRCACIAVAYISLPARGLRLFFSAFYGVLGLGSLFLFLTKARKTGAFHQKIWWDGLRPFHALFFLLASMLIYQQNTWFVPILLLDTCMSIVAFSYRHYA